MGQAFGAGRRGLLRQAALRSSAWAAGTAGLLAIGFALLGPWLIGVMAKDAQVQAEALRYLPWMIAAPISFLGLIMFDGIFIGATRSADMRNMMIVSALIYYAALYLLLEPMGNHGLWLALHISFIARGVTLGARYPALERAVG